MPQRKKVNKIKNILAMVIYSLIDLFTFSILKINNYYFLKH